MRALAAIALVALLAACAPGPHRGVPVLQGQAGVPVVVLMPVDVELYEITAGGMVEPKGEWTDRARPAVETALARFKNSRGIGFRNLGGVGDTETRDLILRTIRLHGAVGQAIAIHRFSPGQTLPSKRERFDWSLGAEVAPIGRAQRADYALFVHLHDSYSSGGRVAMAVAASVLTLGRAYIQMGRQEGFASLVDLRTGEIVWFNRLLESAGGDLRTPEGAGRTIAALLQDFPR